jgi:hypothetical protein
VEPAALSDAVVAVIVGVGGGLVIVMVALPLTPPTVAVMSAEPAETPLTPPLPSTDATPLLDDDQLAVAFETVEPSA